jgi:hypothetical protein
LGVRVRKEQEAEENCVKVSVMISTRRQILIGRSVKGDEMGGSWDAYGREDKCMQGFGEET